MIRADLLEIEEQLISTMPPSVMPGRCVPGYCFFADLGEKNRAIFSRVADFLRKDAPERRAIVLQGEP